jgi:ribosome biogenesis GTPase / thiamine phosphate phosphatase
MNLSDLGFDDWFQDKQKEWLGPECTAARVTEVNRDNYLVRDDRDEVLAELSGNLLFSTDSSLELPAVGDWVFAQYHDNEAHAIIHGCFPRKTFLRRKVSGKKIAHQMIAANVDVAFIVQSCDADFNVRRLERYLVMVNEGGIEPVILLTKSDLADPGQLEGMIATVREAHLNWNLIALSNETGTGLDQLREMLKPRKTYCLMGSSGVGKTTLINHLIGQDLYATQPVRDYDGKGRHTTTRRQLIVLESGSMLIDTPGLKELGNIGAVEGIAESFSDIVEFTGGCRFVDCTHTSEAGCSVLVAVQEGNLSEARYHSYLKLLKESEFYQTSYADKRNKDKKFGRFIKAYLKFDKRK